MSTDRATNSKNKMVSRAPTPNELDTERGQVDVHDEAQRKPLTATFKIRQRNTDRMMTIGTATASEKKLTPARPEHNEGRRASLNGIRPTTTI